MKKLHKKIFKFFANHIVKNQCPEKIQTGDVTKAPCYYLYVYANSEPMLVIMEINAKGVVGKYFDGKNVCGNSCIPYKWIDISDIRITHYYTISIFEYKSFYSYVLHGFTRKDIFIAHLKRAVSNIIQFFYNRKKLVMVQRYELLKILVQNYIDSTHTGIDTIDLMTKLYSTRWIMHPKGDKVEKKLYLYLDSLVETGELTKVNNEYVVLGKAIATIEKYEDTERRHRDNIIIQKIIIFITIILAISALVQAGVIILPTLIDLSGLK